MHAAAPTSTCVTAAPSRMRAVQLRRQAQRDGRRALGHAQALPGLLVVEAGGAGRRRLAQLGQQRRALDRAGREPEVEERALANDSRGRPARPQPVGQRGAVERGRVGVRPRVVGVDGTGERAERRLEAPGLGPLGRREPLAAAHALAQERRPLAVGVDVALLDRQAELLGQPEVGPLERARQLAAELDATAVGQVGLLDAAAHAVARLEHEHVGAAEGEVAGGGQPGEAGAEDEHVVGAHAAAFVRTRRLAGDGVEGERALGPDEDRG